MIAARASPPGRAAVRLLPGRARRRAGRSAGRRASRRLRAVRRALCRAGRVHGHAAPRGRRRGRRASSRRSPPRAAAADRAPRRARRPAGPRHQLPGPHRAADASPPRRRATAPRWIAAAAAAGLFVGVAVGASYQFALGRHAARAGRRSLVARRAPPRAPRASTAIRRAAPARPTSPPTTRSCRISRSRSTGRARASCRPFDALTPHVREISDRVDRARQPSPDAFAHLPQRPRPEARRRRHAGRELSQRASSSGSRPTTSRYRAGRLTVHLAREFGFCYGVDRAVDYAYQTRRALSRSPRVPDRRNHPQPARQRKAAGDGHPLPERRARNSSTRSAPDDVVILPAFGVTVAMLAAARSARLHADRHDLRLGAQRLEERPPLRRGRLHVDHPRQGVARGNAGDRVAGGAVRRHVSRRLRPAPRPRSSATTSAAAATATRS